MLQEFDLHIIDRKGAENPVADNLSRLENVLDDPQPIDDSFPDEQLAAINVVGERCMENKKNSTHTQDLSMEMHSYERGECVYVPS